MAAGGRRGLAAAWRARRPRLARRVSPRAASSSLSCRAAPREPPPCALRCSRRGWQPSVRGVVRTRPSAPPSRQPAGSLLTRSCSARSARRLPALLLLRAPAPAAASRATEADDADLSVERGSRAARQAEREAAHRGQARQDAKGKRTHQAAVFAAHAMGEAGSGHTYRSGRMRALLPRGRCC